MTRNLCHGVSGRHPSRGYNIILGLRVLLSSTPPGIVARVSWDVGPQFVIHVELWTGIPPPSVPAVAEQNLNII